jgi:hypothetical protein
MKDICQMADQNGLQVSLTPTDEFGSSKNRLITFYSRFGFVVNKGKHKDYTISELMYRPTKKKVLGKIYEGGVGRITKQNQTVDVGPNEIKKQAAKFGNKVSKDGVPVMKLQPSGKVGESLSMLSTTPLTQYRVFKANGSHDTVGAMDLIELSLDEGIADVRPIDLGDAAYLTDLAEFSERPAPGKYATVLLMLIGARLSTGHPVDIMTLSQCYSESGVDMIDFTDSVGNTVRFPQAHQRIGGYYRAFLFRSKDNYNKFRMALSLKFSFDLPEMEFTDL